MSAHEETVSEIIVDQQRYAAEKDIAGLFEGLLLSIIYSKPTDPYEHIGVAAAKMQETKSYMPALVGGFSRSSKCRRDA